MEKMVPYLVIAIIRIWPAVISTVQMKKVKTPISNSEKPRGALQRWLSAKQKQRAHPPELCPMRIVFKDVRKNKDV
jgi:hypothetical protein